MSQHRHSEFVSGCYRCDLARDELTFAMQELAREGTDRGPLPGLTADALRADLPVVQREER